MDRYMYTLNEAKEVEDICEIIGAPVKRIKAWGGKKSMLSKYFRFTSVFARQAHMILCGIFATLNENGVTCLGILPLINAWEEAAKTTAIDLDKLNELESLYSAFVSTIEFDKVEDLEKREDLMQFVRALIKLYDYSMTIVSVLWNFRRQGEGKRTQVFTEIQDSLSLKQDNGAVVKGGSSGTDTK